MKPFTFQHWQAWQAQAGILLSDEIAKKLRNFKTPDEAINWLYLNGNKEAARAFNSHVKNA